jgi:hypothetical protein
MWKILKLTLLAAAVENGGSLSKGESLRSRGCHISLTDDAHRNGSASQPLLSPHARWFPKPLGDDPMGKR